MKQLWKRIGSILLLLVMTNCSQRIEERQLNLIPYPQSIILNDDVFVFPDTLNIKMSGIEKKQDLHIFNMLKDALEEQIPLVKCFQSDVENHVSFIRIDRFDKISTKWPVDKIGTEGYVILITPEEMQIAANSSAGLFYGSQTLLQIIRGNRAEQSIPCCEIVDWPDFKYRGWQDDVSRGPIPTVKYLKRQIQTLASYKMNCMTLYTEDIFKLEKHPTLAPKDGISAEEIRELEAFANNYHVEIIGNFQSFGHMGKILRNPRYAHLGERRSELSPAKAESYKFLQDVYSEIAPAYQSRLFHINCDEVRPFDSPQGIAMMDSIGLGGAFAFHINKIHSLLNVYNKRLLMWGDMPMLYPEITHQLPQDLIAVIWVYHPVDDYIPYFKTFQDANMDFMISPGVSSWVRIWPDIDRAVKNIAGFSRQGFNHGSMGNLITTWDDTGDNLFSYNWYPLIWGAECSWNAVREKGNYTKKLERFNYSFDPVFFEVKPLSVTPYLWQFDSLRNNTIADGFATKIFWSSPSLEKLLIQQDNYQADLEELFTKTNSIQQSLLNSKHFARKNQDVIDATLFTVEKIRWLGEKEKFENEILQSMTSSDDLPWVNTRDSLCKQLVSLKDQFCDLWELENRLWWLNRIEEKYDKLASSLEEADKRVYMINSCDDIFSNTLQIELANPCPNAEIYYTIDGQAPGKHTHRYVRPFSLTNTTTLQAVAYVNNIEGPVLHREFVKVEENSGLDYHYYQGVWNEIPDFDKLKPLKRGRILSFNHKPKIRQENFAFLYEGYIQILNPGRYAFALKSDDGSQMIIDNKLVVNNNGLHRTLEKKGEIELSEGFHKIEVSFFGRGGYENLFAFYSGPDVPLQEIPANVLYRMKQ